MEALFNDKGIKETLCPSVYLNMKAVKPLIALRRSRRLGGLTSWPCAHIIVMLLIIIYGGSDGQYHSRAFADVQSNNLSA